MIGAGIGPGTITNVMGITKAYTTRVGVGPFPTECDDAIGERIRQVGAEFGSTTGRSRRCGWLDLVALKYAIRLSGITSIALMKLDVLSGFEKLEICNAYELDGQRITEYPVSPGDLARCKPLYESITGWKEDLTTAKSLKRSSALRSRIHPIYWSECRCADRRGQRRPWSRSDSLD